MAEPLPVTDAAVPAVEMLLGAGAHDLCAAAVGLMGGSPTKLRTSQVRYVPGRSITVQYTADVRWDDGRRSRETLVATAGPEHPEGAAVMEADGIEVAVWRFPDDPLLPGLRSAVDPQRIGELLTSLGAEPAAVQVRTRAYRAGRRAVVEVTGGRNRVYLKVVRPARVAALHQRHIALSAGVTVPRSLGWSSQLGIVALEALPGRPLRRSLEARSRRVPDAAALIGLLDRFPALGPDAVTVAGPCAHARGHGALIAAVVPGLAGRVAAIVDAVSGIGADAPVVVHGDFHTGQVLTDGTVITGLVDVDTSGTGSRADDLAVLLAHLSTLALSSPTRPVIERYGAALIREFDAVTDPSRLRTRTAAAVLGLATGPFRVQEARWAAQTERRVALAERWLDASRAAS